MRMALASSYTVESAEEPTQVRKYRRERCMTRQ